MTKIQAATLLALLLSTPLCATADSPEAFAAPLNKKDLESLSAAAASASIESKAWQRVKELSIPLYQLARKNGDSRYVALHNMLRIGLPGTDISEYGQDGEKIRNELAMIAKHYQKIDQLSESSAVAGTLLDFERILEKHVANENPALAAFSNINLAVLDESGSVSEKYSEPLHIDGKPRFNVEFTKDVNAKEGMACSIETLRFGAEVFFKLKCKNKMESIVVGSKGQCSTNNDEAKAGRIQK
jgi:hypothetical protein